MNFDYLNRVFSAATGNTIFYYLNMLRVSNAKQLITTTNLTFAEVAYLVGIEDRYYFTRLFNAICRHDADGVLSRGALHAAQGRRYDMSAINSENQPRRIGFALLTHVLITRLLTLIGLKPALLRDGLAGCNVSKRVRFALSLHKPFAQRRGVPARKDVFQSVSK